MQVWDYILYSLVIIHVLNPSKIIVAKSITNVQLPQEGIDQAISAVKDPEFIQYREEGPIGFQSSPKRAIGGVVGAEDEDKHLLKGYQKYKRRRSPFGIVYKDGKPIGILEPISRIYEYQNFQDDYGYKNPLNKRDNVDLPNPNDMDNNVKRDTDSAKQIEHERSSKYENSKLHEHLKDKPLDELSQGKGEQKREVEVPVSTKAPVSKRNSNPEDVKLTAIENNLKEIISDLNTINEDDENDSLIEKRDTQAEDEDLDNGANKIGITKELHALNTKKIVKNTSGMDSGIKQKKRQNLSSNEDNEYFNSQTGEKIADYRTEGENFIRKKRQQANSASARNDGNDIVKGLEASGDLTVSGNKSPLASSSAPVETETKSKNIKGENFEKRDKQTAEDLEYEKRLQRNIHDKISEIKEQVKREIKALKSSSSSIADPNDHQMPLLLEGSQMKKKRDMSASNNEVLQKVRNKRNLLERAENRQLDLVQNTEAEALTPHIRLRREADEIDEEAVDQNAVENLNSNPPNDNRFDVGSSKDLDISKREGAKQVTKEPSESGTKLEEESELGKDSGKSPLGFQGDSVGHDAASKRASEQPEVGRVLAMRNTKPIATAAALLDNDKLEKLVKESSTLTESIKSERGARYSEMGPHIEVELHSSPKMQANQKHDKPETANILKRDEEESVALAENHAEDSEVVINNDDIVLKKRETRSKQSTEKKQQVHNNADNEEKAKLVDSNAAAESSYKVYETASSKLAQESVKPSDASVSSEAKSIEIRTDSPEGASKLVDDGGSKSSASSDGDKEDKLKSVTSSADKNDVANLDADDADSESSMVKRSPHLNPQDDKQSVEADASNKVIRQERKSEPNLSLEDMQELDSENKMKRKRRYANDDYYYSSREKRAQYPIPNYIRFRNYRGDEDEADDESDEFDDDNFDDRTANMVRKRATQDNDNYDDLDEDYEPMATNQEGAANRVNKRHANAREFVAKMNDDVYDNSNYLYDSSGSPLNRNKRHISDSTDSISALHSGGPMIHHLAAVRERNSNINIDNAYRKKRLEKIGKLPANMKNGMDGLSETDIFGGLPQSYEGELTRFKRVKRDDPSAIDTMNSESP